MTGTLGVTPTSPSASGSYGGVEVGLNTHDHEKAMTAQVRYLRVADLDAAVSR